MLLFCNPVEIYVSESESESESEQHTNTMSTANHSVFKYRNQAQKLEEKQSSKEIGVHQTDNWRVGWYHQIHTSRPPQMIRNHMLWSGGRTDKISNKLAGDVACLGGSMVEHQPRLLGSRVRFPAGAFAIFSVSAKASLPISLPPFPFLFLSLPLPFLSSSAPFDLSCTISALPDNQSPSNRWHFTWGHPIRQIFFGSIPNIEDRVYRLHTRAMGLWDSLIFGKKSTIKMDTWEGYGIVPQVLSKRSCRRRFRCCSLLFRCSSDGDRHQENELQKPCFSTSHGTDSHLKITGRPRICRSSWTRRAGESKFDVGFGEIETVQHCSWFVGSCTRRGPPTSILAARRLSGIHLWSTSTLQGQLEQVSALPVHHTSVRQLLQPCCQPSPSLDPRSSRCASTLLLRRVAALHKVRRKTTLTWRTCDKRTPFTFNDGVLSKGLNFRLKLLSEFVFCSFFLWMLSGTNEGR